MENNMNGANIVFMSPSARKIYTGTVAKDEGGMLLIINVMHNFSPVTFALGLNSCEVPKGNAVFQWRKDGTFEALL